MYKLSSERTISIVCLALYEQTATQKALRYESFFFVLSAENLEREKIIILMSLNAITKEVHMCAIFLKTFKETGTLDVRMGFVLVYIYINISRHIAKSTHF
jgi:hypothetical protein